MSAPVDRVQPVAPPPQDVPLVQRIVEILLAAYAIDKTAELIAAMILAPYKITKVAVAAVLTMLDTVHAPRTRLGGIDRRSAAAEITRQAAREDTFYRAAYVAAASGRVQRSLDAGKSIEQAIEEERRHFEAHKTARDKRLEAAADTARNAERYGWLLGWYRNPLLDSDADCRIADGNNFDAREGTVIGWPGSVHPHCGCSAGPPHPLGDMVNDVLGDVLGRMSPRKAPAEKLGLRRTG
jgi:hypothetical protein